MPKRDSVLCKAENCSIPSGILILIKCNFCKTCYHGVCVKSNFCESEKLEIYKCVKCSNVRLIDPACSNKLTLESAEKASKAGLLKRVPKYSRTPVANSLTEKLMIQSECVVVA